MTRRHVVAIAVTGIACTVTVAPALAQLRDGGILPPKESAVVTVAGCLMRGDQVRGGQQGKYVLAQPRVGPVSSVPEERCAAAPGDNALALDNPDKGNVSEAMLGRWIEVSGRLERETSTNPDNLRELDVSSARLVPVVPPQAAAAPIPEPPAPLPEIPVATSGEIAAPLPEVLPQTASRVPAIGLLGMFALVGALALRAARTRQGGQS
jgi:hypothetical protein